MSDDNILQQLGQHASKHTAPERDVLGRLGEAFLGSPLQMGQKLVNFARSVRRQDVSRFLAKYEVFKLNLPVMGSVVECGVFAGGGLFGWAHFSAILEPYNHSRRVIGFDTFEGFPHVHDKDVRHGSSEHLKPQAFATHASIREELEHFAAIYDSNRPLGHVPKIAFVPGDARVTIPRHLAENPHLLVSLLYLDFDLYEPTLVALKQFWPRMPKGAVVAFDELNCQDFPGETTALIEAIDLGRAAVRRFPFEPYISYFVKE